MGRTIVMDLKDIFWEGVDWIDLAEGWGKWRAVLKRQWTYAFHKMQEVFD
jgi:hypothetical protein